MLFIWILSIFQTLGALRNERNRSPGEIPRLVFEKRKLRIKRSNCPTVLWSVQDHFQLVVGNGPTRKRCWRATAPTHGNHSPDFMFEIYVTWETRRIKKVWYYRTFDWIIYIILTKIKFWNFQNFYSIAWFLKVLKIDFFLIYIDYIWCCILLINLFYSFFFFFLVMPSTCWQVSIQIATMNWRRNVTLSIRKIVSAVMICHQS